MTQFCITLKHTETGDEAEVFTDLSREEALACFEGNLPTMERFLGKRFTQKAVNVYGTSDGKQLAFIKKIPENQQ